MLSLMMTACFPAKPSNAIEELAEGVIKSKEGVDIRITPVDNVKQAKAEKK